MVYIRIFLMMIFPCFSALCMDDFSAIKETWEPKKISLRFVSPPPSPRMEMSFEASESEDEDGGLRPNHIDYPNVSRLWPHMKSLHPYIRPEGFPFMEALIRCTSRMSFHTHPTLIRILYQVTYDLSEAFREQDIDHAVYGKTLLSFCRHKGLSKWQTKVHFAINARDHSRVQEITQHLNALGYILSPLASGYSVYWHEKINLRGLEKEESSRCASDPIAILRLYKEEEDGLSFIGLNPQKDDWIPKKNWYAKSSEPFGAYGDKIKVHVIGNYDEYLNTLYGHKYKTHEIYKKYSFVLSENDLKMAIPSEGGLRQYRPFSSEKCLVQ